MDYLHDAWRNFIEVRPRGLLPKNWSTRNGSPSVD